MSLKNNFIKRVSAILLCFIVLAVQLGLNVFAAAQTVSYTVAGVSGNKGESVSVPVKIVTSDGKKLEVNGIRFTVEYDTNKLEYVAHSVTNSINNIVAYDNKAGTVTCAWFDTTSVKVSSNTALLTISFRIKDEASGSAELKLSSKEIYKSEVATSGTVYNHYTCTTPTVKATVTIGTDSAVQKVIDSINQIGTVTNSEECLNKINEASKLYGKLNAAQKEKVTNYSKLQEAIEKYNKLKADESAEKIAEEVAKFRQRHAEALAVRITEGEEELSLSKYNILQAAYDEFGTGNGKLSAGAQAELLTEYRRLGFYLEMLKDAKAAEQEKEHLENLKKWEYQLCQAYVHGGYEIDPLTGEYVKDDKGKNVWIKGLTESDSEWLDILTKTKKNVTAIDYTRLDYFKTSWYDNMIALHPDVETVMNDECDGAAKKFLEAHKKAYELYLIENPELTDDQIAANNFRSKFSYVLGLSKDTVTYDDLNQIEIALTVYDFMTDGAKELLSKEHSLLEQLKSAAAGKTTESGGGDITGPASSVFDSSAEANSLYNAFNQTWSNVFGMKVEDVTAEDYPVLLAMINQYEALCSMNPEISKLLADQMKSVYALYDKAAELNGATGGDSTVVAGPAVAGWDSNTVLEFLGRDVGMVVWVLIALLILSTAIFVVLRIFYHSLKKNKALFAEEVAI